MELSEKENRSKDLAALYLSVVDQSYKTLSGEYGQGREVRVY